MSGIFDALNWAPIAACFVLVAFVLAKFNQRRFRKRAVEVRGEVLKIFAHRQHTSYFIQYIYDGSTRVAEYAGMPLLREFKVGEQVDILIDGTAPPNVVVPDKMHIAISQQGNCQLPGEPLVSIWDVVVVVICTYVICRDYIPWLH